MLYLAVDLRVVLQHGARLQQGRQDVVVGRGEGSHQLLLFGNGRESKVGNAAKGTGVGSIRIKGEESVDEETCQVSHCWRFHRKLD